MPKAVKMADGSEGECVGESSSRHLVGVRQAVREVMKEALHSKKNEDLLSDLLETGPSDVEGLIQEKQRLMKEKRLCEIDLELRKRLGEESPSDATVTLEDLEQRVAELERDVIAARSRLFQDQQLIQRLQNSEAMTEHLFQRPDPTAEDKALRGVVGEQCEVSVKVGRVGGEIGEEERELVELRRERRECQTKCRELLTKIEALRREPVEEGEGTGEVTRLQAVLQAKVAECKLLQGSLQGVIVGSGVDWSEDEQLRDLLVSLGHTFPWEH